MGTDPRHSATDRHGTVWGHENLRVVDASLHVTNGGVNPVLTILANAFRVMHDWVGSGAGPGPAPGSVSGGTSPTGR
jgi:choline dehydrogenase-like flavoprotein